MCSYQLMIRDGGKGRGAIAADRIPHDGARGERQGEDHGHTLSTRVDDGARDYTRSACVHGGLRDTHGASGTSPTSPQIGHQSPPSGGTVLLQRELRGW